jgi:hypothetical protein
MGTSKVGGTATLAAGTAAGTSVATLSLTGGTPGTAYAWHVHTGKCGSGGVFGGGASYKPVTAGADGKASSTANLKAAMPANGDYHVNVHLASDMSVIACGNLGMGGM